MITAISIRFPSFDILAFARLLCLCLLIVAAIPLTVALVHFAWPFVVAAAGKLLVGGGATAAFGLVFRP